MGTSTRLNSLIVYRNLLEDEVVQGLGGLVEMSDAELSSKLLEKAEALGLTGNVPVEYVLYLIAYQKNVFPAMSEKHRGKVGEGLKAAVASDVEILRTFISKIATEYGGHTLFSEYVATNPHFIPGRSILVKLFVDGAGSVKEVVDELCSYYANYGYGLMLEHMAFRWDGENACLIGTKNNSDMSFDKIYGYEYQKSELISNTQAFLEGKPANNVLLFGDRGTGKSSSIKALSNQFYDQGLRLVEVARHDFIQLPKILSVLSNWGKHFLVILDDLSFEEFEVEYKHLKSVLDGGLEVRPNNVLFYATSNRRNIVKEVWQDQNMNELHSRDSINEKISLADRFGIKLYFDSMDQKEYLYMLNKMAAAEGLEITEEELKSAALKWEMSHTGRNGRIARQLLDYLHGQGKVE